MARTLKNTAWNEVFALLLLGIGTLLFLALISYAPRDLPSWVPFSHVSPPNRPAQNFIGPFGAIIAGFSYLMIGAASYLLAVVLLGFGGAKLFHSRLRVTPRLLWIALFIISGACLLQLQTRHLQGWRAAFNIHGPGGWVGYSLGKKLLQTWMGGVGSRHSPLRYLCEQPHSHDGPAPDSHCPGNGRGNAKLDAEIQRMASQSPLAKS